MVRNSKTGRRVDEPNMSDKTLLVSVEDLINMAMGPSDVNIVNFKLVQTILHILARQMRMLEQRVEIRIADERASREGSPSLEDIREGRERKKRRPSKDRAVKTSKDRGKSERDKESPVRDKEKREGAISKEREAADKHKDKEERATSKERDKASKEREREERAAERDKEKAERATSKEREKIDKEREKADRAASKERDKEGKEKEKAEKSAEKERDKADRATSKEREKSEKAAEKDRVKMEKEKDRADKTAAKDKDREEKMSAKERENAAKEKEKEEKMSAKEREKAAKEKEKEEKMSAKESEKASKEKEKEEKMSAKEREKAAKDKEKYEKMTAKEREVADKAAAKEAERESSAKSKERSKGKTGSDMNIKISEVDRQKEKVLVVEKGPTTRTGDTRRESIEVVTRSQFNIVETMVRKLQGQAGPPPPPALPDNKQLRDELARGNASLTDTMQAMQVTARVRAAEQAIGRMGDLLTELAASGALPDALMDQIDEVRFEAPDADTATIVSLPMKPRGTTAGAGVFAGQKSVAIDPMFQGESEEALSKFGASSRSVAGVGSMGRPSVSKGASRASMATSRASVASSAPGMPGVTHPEMDVALRMMREELIKQLQNMTAKASSVAENAASTAKGVADKMDIALLLDKRISGLNGVVVDHFDQLLGFDSGLTSQMQSFRDQITQIKTDLQAGLKQLEQVNNNAETAAVIELTERYQGLALELDHTLHAHSTLTISQRQLSDELKSLVECVEMLREQKADRDEVLDGLRDKADNERLAGLLTVGEFELARGELEKRLDVCHDKFRRQEMVWMTALKDLMLTSESKAELTQLLSAREHAQQMLRELQQMLEQIAIIVGEPKAAVLTRQLSKGASCAACLVPALMEPQDKSFGAPPPLPAARPLPRDYGLCVPTWQPPVPPDDRDHTCHRWVGGSHTLLSPAVVREQAHAVPAAPAASPTKRYTGYGSDGRLYQLEEEMQPCVECNQYSEKALEEAEAPPEQGAGDQGQIQEPAIKILPDDEKK